MTMRLFECLKMESQKRFSFFLIYQQIFEANNEICSLKMKPFRRLKSGSGVFRPSLCFFDSFDHKIQKLS